ncbi:MAG: AAA family ATPase [Chitinophagaceae bacterium]
MDITFTHQEKEKISAMLLQQAEESGMVDKKFAITVGLVASDISNLANEKWKENKSLIGDKKWLTIARIVGYERNEHLVWKPAKTEVWEYVYENLSRCKQYAFTSILVDDPGIGKTYTAKQFARAHKNAFYMNCSNASGKREFMTEFSKSVGISKSGKLREQFSDALYLISQLENPIIILDEVGDLDNSTILLIKKYTINWRTSAVSI